MKHFELLPIGSRRSGLHGDWVAQRTASTSTQLIFLSMENTCTQTFLSVSQYQTEYYLHPKCDKTESNQENIEEEEQQKLEQSICCVNRYQTPPNEPVYLSERQNSWALEKESCDRARKTCVREFSHFQTCNSKRLPCRVLENNLSTKRQSPENEDQNIVQDDISLDVYGQPLETEFCNVWSATNTCKNLQVLNPIQVLQDNNIEQNKIKDDNELKQNCSVTPLNRDLFQMEMLSHRSVSDKRWRQYQLLQVPFLCGTSSMLSQIEHKKNIFLEKVCSTENKDYYNNGHQTTTERDNKEKYNSYVIPTSKPFKSIEPLEIPNFLMKETTFHFPSISNKIKNKMPSTKLKEMDGKTPKDQPSLMPSKQICGVQKISEIGNQNLQNDENIVKASSAGSECKEKNYQSVSKQEYSAWVEEDKASATYFRGINTDIECNLIFVESDFKDKMLEKSDGEDDQKSRIHIYISAKKVQNKKVISSMDILKGLGRKNSHNRITFNIQKSILAATEALEKNKLDIHHGLHNSNADIRLYEAASKLSTEEILDFKRYLTKNIVFESNCTPIVVQNFPDKKVSFNIVRGKKWFKLRFSFQNLLFGAFRTWAESLHKNMPKCQADGILHCFHFCKTLNNQCYTQELVKRNISRSHNNKTCIYLLAIVSKHLKLKLQKTILASFFNKKKALLPTEGKFMRVEKHPSCGRKQVQLSSCTDSNLRQNTDFYKKYETYPGIVKSKFVNTISFELHNECQRRHFSRTSGDEKSTFLNRGTIFHNQKRGLPRGRCIRKDHLLSRGSERFLSTYLKSVSHKKDMKKQILISKCLILLQGNCDCSSLEKIFCSKVTKMQYLIRANLRFLTYLPAYSQLKFEKVNYKCSNQQILVTTIKQAKNVLKKMFISCFHRERLIALPCVLNDNEKHKTTGFRNCIKSTNEVIYKKKKYLDTFSYVKADNQEYFKTKKLQISLHNFMSKKSLPIFDTYKKIPLNNDSEDFDQLLLVNQYNSVKKMTTEENTISSSENIDNLSDKSKDVLALPEQSKTTMEKCCSLLLQDSQTKKPEYCKEIDACSLHVANEKKIVDFPNAYLSSGNIFVSSISGYQSITSPLHSSTLISKDGVVSDDGRCRSCLSAENQNRYERIHATMHDLSTGSPTVTDIYFQLQAKETVYFSLQGHTQTNKAVSLEAATWKQHLEYVKQEEISDEQMHVTNESQCESVMNDLIMSYSEDESKTFIAAEEKLKMHLSVMNNGCLEDIKDEYLPSENKITYEFELKRKFDLVLEELRMFHEISKGNENNLSSVETNSHNNYRALNNSEGIDENVESVYEKKTCVSSPVCGTIEGQNITDSSLNEKISHENEDQEAPKVYCISRLLSEELIHSPIAEGEFDSVHKMPYTWDPAFLSCMLSREQNYNLQKEGGYFLSHEVARVQPLKTCKGPIRIGLSRKARPQKLHPYLK
uniref:RAD51 interacting motif domain-containing protein n=1 Tax=Anser cygnoides TaxID=8845 RepID=A0A8B9DG99_ANSCY